MGRELDQRNFSVSRITSARQREITMRTREVSANLSGEHRLRIAKFDPTTGNSAVVVSEAAPVIQGNYVQRSLEHLHTISPSLGLAPTQPVEFVPDHHIQRTSSGAVAVHLGQHYKDIPIFQASQTVRFAPNGALQETAGTAINIADEKAVATRVSVNDAVLKAAQHVATPAKDELTAKDQFGEPLKLTSVDLNGFAPKLAVAFKNQADQPTLLEAGPFGARFKASLVWFPLKEEVRLAWQVMVTLPDGDGRYRVLVDAETGDILYCHQLIKYIAAKGNVFLVDGDGPRQTVNFPRSLSAYDLDTPDPDLPFFTPLPAGFPDDWVSGPFAAGNCVNAHSDEDGSSIIGIVKDGVVVFDPNSPNSNDQKVLNLFYYNCYIHDYFYLLGFREADGNFQNSNFGRGGEDGDAVEAQVLNHPVEGTASMDADGDGSKPTMKMGLALSTIRPTALDSSVVFHEFTHGVTDRLVGGPNDDSSLEQPQSGGMGEGWSDFTACTINKTKVVGAWVSKKEGGIRKFPYDSNYPHNFGDLGKVVGGIDFSEVHNVGEIWCATLMEMNRNIGSHLGMQLVVDALKLSAANPSFLDMRDAILRALSFKITTGQITAVDGCGARKGIWKAFAKFGMGPGAVTIGPSLFGCVPDFAEPFAGEDEVFRDTWTTGWSSFVAFTLQGKAHHLAYKIGSGDVEISRMKSDAQGIDKLWKDTWAKGWSSFMPFDLNGIPHYLAYNVNTGEVDVDRIRSDGKGIDTIWQGTWTKGWTNLVPFVLNGAQHYLIYKTHTGDVAIGRIGVTGKAENPFWRDTWAGGWTSFVPFVLNSRPHYLAYKVSNGDVNIDRIKSDGKGVETIHAGKFAIGWTSFVPFDLGGKLHQLAYKVGSGDVKIYRIKPGGKGIEILWEDAWTTEWTSMFGFQLKGQWHLLLYKIFHGTAAIDHICDR